MQKVLIDENLSPLLAVDAQQRGFLGSHVNHLGKTGWKDWELKQTILDGDWTFITNNSIDFRGPSNQPGLSGQYAGVCLHAGLVCIDAPSGLNLKLQRELFAMILDELENGGDLTNQLLEVSLGKSGRVDIRRIAFPPDEIA